mmetsp:Transcript_12343/g.25597  ORF Transcript_12343/g.25597 Transcript_12343/m.25597 type:complete len:399 (-) Transcript_12343:1525-2721(-)
MSRARGKGIHGFLTLLRRNPTRAMVYGHATPFHHDMVRIVQNIMPISKTRHGIQGSGTVGRIILVASGSSSRRGMSTIIGHGCSATIMVVERSAMVTAIVRLSTPRMTVIRNRTALAVVIIMITVVTIFILFIRRSFIFIVRMLVENMAIMNIFVINIIIIRTNSNIFRNFDFAIAQTQQVNGSSPIQNAMLDRGTRTFVGGNFFFSIVSGTIRVQGSVGMRFSTASSGRRGFHNATSSSTGTVATSHATLRSRIVVGIMAIVGRNIMMSHALVVMRMMMTSTRNIIFRVSRGVVMMQGSSVSRIVGLSSGNPFQGILNFLSRGSKFWQGGIIIIGFRGIGKGFFISSSSIVNGGINATSHGTVIAESIGIGNTTPSVVQARSGSPWRINTIPTQRVR